MNDDQERGDPQDPHQDIDSGEPIVELAALRVEPGDRFLGRIRGSIQRRLFASDAMEFSIQALFGAFFEYLGMMFTAMGGSRPDEKDGKP